MLCHGDCRDDSQVNDVAGSLMRCQHVCPSCSKKTVFYEHQNTVALCIPPPPPQVQPIQAPSNLIDIKVVYLPEVPQQTRNFSFASLKQLLQPQVWMVPVNQENSVSALRERIAKLLPSAALKQCNEKIVLVEASNANRSTVQAKFLDDSTSLASLSPARLVYCYCPIHIYKKRLLLLQVLFAMWIDVVEYCFVFMIVSLSSARHRPLGARRSAHCGPVHQIVLVWISPAGFLRPGLGHCSTPALHMDESVSVA